MTTYTIYAIVNLKRGEVFSERARFDSLKHLLEAIAQEMNVYSTATSFVFTIVPHEENGEQRVHGDLTEM